jgi:SM-20-related protein
MAPPKVTSDVNSDFLTIANASSAKLIVESVATNSLVIVPNYLSKTVLDPLLIDFTEHWDMEKFNRAGMGKHTLHTVNDEVRRDSTYWIDPINLTSPQANLWNMLEELRLEFNRQLYIGLLTLEGHYAQYPAGGYYKRHLDRFNSDDARTVTVVIYLNQNWKSENGGELKVYLMPNEEPLKIEPVAGTLVCFLSDRIEHEVSPSICERRSFAGWFKRRT